MKKMIQLIGIAFFSLCMCWFIGQQLRMVKEEDQIQEQEPMEVSALFQNVQFENVQDTTDNPWGKTAGLFEMEDLGNCIFMTPNTAVTLPELQGREKVMLQYEIHPWTRESSDGAGILLWLLDEEDTILYRQEILVNASEEWADLKLSLKEYEGVTKLKLFCNNGTNGDDSGDWIILREK